MQIRPPLPDDLDLGHHPGTFGPAEADGLLAQLLTEIAWEQKTIRLFGREIPSPRLTAWYGDPGARYGYSGLRLEPLPWIPVLRTILERVEPIAACSFDSVLANRYRNGTDSMGWHADDEPELGPEPVIASVSFGATRRFQLRHRDDRSRRVDLTLGHGDLLVMRGATQRTWQHRIPKERRVETERVNLTFRRIVRPNR